MLLGTGIYDTANLATANAHSDSILDLSQLTVRMNDESARGGIGCYVNVWKAIVGGLLTKREVRVGKVGASEKIVSWLNSIDGFGTNELIDAALDEINGGGVEMEELDEAFDQDLTTYPTALGNFLCSRLHNLSQEAAEGAHGVHCAPAQQNY